MAMEKVMATGKELGLDGDKLREFVEKNLQIVSAEIEKEKEREERRLEREAQRLKMESDNEAEQKRIDAQREVEEIKLKADEVRIKAEKETLAMKLEAEKEAESKRMQHEIEMKKIEADVSLEQSKHESTMLETANKPKPKLPFFDEKVDEMDSYLQRFEWIAECYHWDKGDWPHHLSQYLKGKATDAYTRLSNTDRRNYDKVKAALLERFNLTEDGYRRKLRESEALDDETPQQFITRLQDYLTKWVELAHGKDLEQLIIIEQFISACPSDLAIHLNQMTFDSIGDLAQTASRYLNARGRKLSKSKKTSKPDNPSSLTPVTTRTDAGCFICGRKDHLARTCPQRGKKYCSNCKMNNHNTVDCTKRTGRATHNAGAVMQEETQVEDTGDESSTEMIINGRKFVSVAMCQQINSGKGNVNIVRGEVNGVPIKLIRDTGCSTIVVKQKFVNPDDIVDDKIYLQFADGRTREAKCADITIRSPFLSGRVRAAVMDDNLLHDLLIGNVPEARAADDPQLNWEQCSVTTRAQATQEKRGDKPLVVTQQQPLSVGRHDLIRLQQQDETLKRFYQVDEHKQSAKGSRFSVEGGILYREYSNPKQKDARPIKQVMVPVSLRREVLQKAHDCILSGHLGVRKTSDRILTNFFWPGINDEVVRFCRSCDTCQKTVKKGSVSKVPVQITPLIDTPFKRCAVDLIGPIHPPSEKGHRYILTLVDYATRYPEAVALKNIDSISVAEALLDIYSRVGVPDEVVSDQGTQFISEYMKEFSRLLGMRQLPTTPYHAMANGLVERFNGTLKSMLKKLCIKEPSQWHRFINAALFAYREIPQESTGFSPFELLYGRTIRGPMYILRQLWTQEEASDEVKTSYQHVFDLRERLDDIAGIARQTLSTSQKRYKHYFDKKAKGREFSPGEKVLIMLPTNNNKLLMQWKGPYTVEEKVGINDYKIDIGMKRRTYHANMLKRYYERQDDSKAQTIGAVSTIMEVAGVGIITPQPDDEMEDEFQDGLLDLYTSKMKQREDINDIILPSELDKGQQSELKSLLFGYKDTFSDVPGDTKLMKHSIQLTTNDLIKGKPYGLPYSVRETLKGDIEDMLAMGVIRPSTSGYASPTVIVRKPDGSNRVCVDYRKLNKVTVFDPEPMVTTKDLFQKLSGDRFYTKLDLSKGYWQVPVRPEDIDKTAFVTPDGHYEFLKMPFGMVNSGATLVRGMRKLLGDLKGVDCYIDDILIHTKTWEDHIRLLQQVFERLLAAGLTVRPTKCRFGETNVEFVGHKIDQNGVQPMDDNVEKIRRAPRPVTKTQVRSFIGLTSYYREYIPNYSSIASPLTDLTKKGQPNTVLWEESQEKAYRALKTMITSAPVLKIPDVSKPFTLRTDASNVGLGAVLLQEYDGKLFPVSY